MSLHDQIHFVCLGSSGWIWKASDCSSHTRAGECGESGDGWGQPETRRVWERRHTHSLGQQRWHQDKKRSESLSNHSMSKAFWGIKQSWPLILQDKQSTLSPRMMTVSWRHKDLASPRKLSSLSAVTKRRMRRVSATSLQPFNYLSVFRIHLDVFTHDIKQGWVGIVTLPRMESINIHILKEEMS